MSKAKLEMGFALREGSFQDWLKKKQAVINPKVNKARGRSGNWAQSRKTHCPKGHAYSRENTHITPKGHRQCKACRTEAGRRYQQGRGRVWYQERGRELSKKRYWELGGKLKERERYLAKRSAKA